MIATSVTRRDGNRCAPLFVFLPTDAQLTRGTLLPPAVWRERLRSSDPSVPAPFFRAADHVVDRAGIRGGRLSEAAARKRA